MLCVVMYKCIYDYVMFIWFMMLKWLLKSNGENYEKKRRTLVEIVDKEKRKNTAKTKHSVFPFLMFSKTHGIMISFIKSSSLPIEIALSLILLSKYKLEIYISSIFCEDVTFLIVSNILALHFSNDTSVFSFSTILSTLFLFLAYNLFIFNLSQAFKNSVSRGQWTHF